MDIGTHLIVDMSGIKPKLLNYLDYLSNSMVLAVECAKVTYISEITHQFSPHGVTVLILLGESHMSIHTYPEHGYAAVDFFTCGNKANPQKGIEYLIEKLRPTHYKITEIPRLIPEG